MLSLAALRAEMPLKARVHWRRSTSSVSLASRFFQHFADAEDGSKSGLQRAFQAAVHGVVGFAEVLAALGVADDDKLEPAGTGEHGGRNFAGEGALVFPIDILRAHFDVAATGLLDTAAMLTKDGQMTISSRS